MNSQEQSAWLLPIPPEECQFYMTLYQQLISQTGTPSVDGRTARSVFMKSGLPEQDLAEIWMRVDTSKQGFLNMKQFCEAMALIKRKLWSNQQQSAPTGFHGSASVPVLPNNAAANLNPNIPITGVTALPNGSVIGAQDRLGAGLPLANQSQPVMPSYFQQQQPQQRPDQSQSNNSVASNFPPSTVTQNQSNHQQQSAAIKSVEQPGSSTPNPTPSSLPTTNTAPVQTNSNEEQFMNMLFQKLDPQQRGYVTGGEAVPFFRQSGLPDNVLAEIWTSVDVQKQGKLDLAQFKSAMGLVKRYKQPQQQPPQQQQSHTQQQSLPQQQPQQIVASPQSAVVGAGSYTQPLSQQVQPSGQSQQQPATQGQPVINQPASSQQQPFSQPPQPQYSAAIAQGPSISQTAVMSAVPKPAESSPQSVPFTAPSSAGGIPTNTISLSTQLAPVNGTTTNQSFASTKVQAAAPAAMDLLDWGSTPVMSPEPVRASTNLKSNTAASGDLQKSLEKEQDKLQQFEERHRQSVSFKNQEQEKIDALELELKKAKEETLKVQEQWKAARKEAQTAKERREKLEKEIEAEKRAFEEEMKRLSEEKDALKQEQLLLEKTEQHQKKQKDELQERKAELVQSMSKPKETLKSPSTASEPPPKTFASASDPFADFESFTNPVSASVPSSPPKKVAEPLSFDDFFKSTAPTTIAKQKEPSKEPAKPVSSSVTAVTSPTPSQTKTAPSSLSPSVKSDVNNATSPTGPESKSQREPSPSSVMNDFRSRFPDLDELENSLPKATQKPVIDKPDTTKEKSPVEKDPFAEFDNEFSSVVSKPTSITSPSQAAKVFDVDFEADFAWAKSPNPAKDKAPPKAQEINIDEVFGGNPFASANVKPITVVTDDPFAIANDGAVAPGTNTDPFGATPFVPRPNANISTKIEPISSPTVNQVVTASNPFAASTGSKDPFGATPNDPFNKKASSDAIKATQESVDFFAAIKSNSSKSIPAEIRKPVQNVTKDSVSVLSEPYAMSTHDFENDIPSAQDTRRMSTLPTGPTDITAEEQNLVKMGFTIEKVREALSAYPGNVDRAVHYLLDSGVSPKSESRPGDSSSLQRRPSTGSTASSIKKKWWSLGRKSENKD